MFRKALRIGFLFPSRSVSLHLPLSVEVRSHPLLPLERRVGWGLLLQVWIPEVGSPHEERVHS